MKILCGICIWNWKLIPDVATVGYDYFETNVKIAVDPDKDDEWWKRRRDEIMSLPVRLKGCNGFLPGKFRLTGPKADFGPALEYGERALRRAEEVGIDTVVLGSSAARNVPGDYCAPSRRDWPDAEKGTLQFTDFCHELARRTEDLRHTAVVIEPLCRNESNIVNFVSEGVQICKDVNSPRIQQLADFFHMMQGRESADEIIKAAKYLKHCHAATYKSRVFLGAEGEKNFDKLRPYFSALRQIDYTGGVSIEGSWPKEYGGISKEALAKGLSALRSLVVGQV